MFGTGSQFNNTKNTILLEFSKYRLNGKRFTQALFTLLL